MIDIRSRHESHNRSDRRVPISLPRVHLEIIRGRARNKLREVSTPVFLIGSAPDCDLVLRDPRFPDVYAYLFVTPQGASLRYLGEGPEMTVDGTLTESVRLQNGSRIRAGSYEFHVFIEGSTDGPHRWRPARRDDTHDQAPILHVVGLLRDVRNLLKVRKRVQNPSRVTNGPLHLDPGGRASA